MNDVRPLAERVRDITDELTITASEVQIRQLETYLRTLALWNRTINLTALDVETFSSQALDRLIREPLSALPWLGHGRAGRWVDLGSGSGSPAIPLRVFLTEADLTMVESRGRKAAFLREACARASLERVRVLTGRLETLDGDPAESAELISARAIRIDQAAASTIRHLIRSGGEVLLFGGTNWDALASFAQPVRLSEDGVALLNVPRGTSPQ